MVHLLGTSLDQNRRNVKSKNSSHPELVSGSSYYFLFWILDVGIRQSSYRLEDDKLINDLKKHPCDRVL